MMHPDPGRFARTGRFLQEPAGPTRNSPPEPVMHPTPILYHNPRCTKSREARRLLEDRGVELVLVHYLEEPPTRDELDALIGLLGGTPADLLRANEPLARELGLTAASDPEAILDALAEHPILIQRPVLIVGGRAVIGRPPERVLELI